MAARKNAASAKDAGKIIVAFALCDHVEGEGADALSITDGQRLELEKPEFDALEKDGIVEEGVFVKMKTSIEGGRYSLKPHDETWLPKRVYEAWKALGYCAPSKDDPQVDAVLKAREEALRDAVAERDAARLHCTDLEAQLQEAVLMMAAARAQAEKLRGMIEPDTESGDEVLGEAAAEFLAEADVLIDMFPDQDETPGGGSEDPHLKLD